MSIAKSRGRRLLKIMGFWTLLLKIVRCRSFIMDMSNSSHPNCTRKKTLIVDRNIYGYNFVLEGIWNTLIHNILKLKFVISCTKVQVIITQHNVVICSPSRNAIKYIYFWEISPFFVRIIGMCLLQPAYYPYYIVQLWPTRDM